MADQDPKGPPILVEAASSRCVHLRSSGMYIKDDEPGGGPGDGDDFRAYWCFQTLKSFGPDDCLVDSRACRDRSRTCYEPI
jgi:hypothetical protein